MLKRLGFLFAALALCLAPLSANAMSGPGWMEVRIAGLPSGETVRIEVMYYNSKDVPQMTHQFARSGETVSFALGSKAHNLHVIGNAEGVRKSVQMRFATLPPHVVLDFGK